MVEPGSAGLPPFPDGWFVIGFDDELPARRVIARRFMGQELVLYRTESGRVCVSDAHCPHLGAHLGHGGTVVGESIRCPFHGFRFDPTGACVATGYGTKPPAVRIEPWPVHETHGLILVHHAPDRAAPTWRVPDLAQDGWTQFLHRTYTIRAHPQESTENSVDLGHFGLLHGFRSVEMTEEPVVDGAYLSTRYTARWMVASREIPFAFRTHIHGLGYSLVEAKVAGGVVELRLLVLPTPLDARESALRLALQVRRIPHGGVIHRSLRAVPGRALSAMVARALFEAFARATHQDVPIWEHKRFLERPALAKGDGPIALYRRWARQFYPERRDDTADERPALRLAATSVGVQG